MHHIVLKSFYLALIVTLICAYSAYCKPVQAEPPLPPLPEVSIATVPATPPGQGPVFIVPRQQVLLSPPLPAIKPVLWPIPKNNALSLHKNDISKETAKNPLFVKQAAVVTVPPALDPSLPPTKEDPFNTKKKSPPLTNLILTFNKSDTTLTDRQNVSLRKKVVPAMRLAPGTDLLIQAYAPNDMEHRDGRRTALTRARMIESFLINQGLSSTRIHVQVRLSDRGTQNDMVVLRLTQ